MYVYPRLECTKCYKECGSSFVLFPADVWVDWGADKRLFIPPLWLLVLIPPTQAFAF